MVDAQFFRADAQFFAAGLLWPRNYAFCCCWTTFTLEIMVLCHVYPLLSMCKLCLPLTEHVQILYWARAEIIYIIYPVFDSLIDNCDTNITWTQTQTHWLNHLPNEWRDKNRLICKICFWEKQAKALLPFCARH